jgi:hypothetical protein
MKPPTESRDDRDLRRDVRLIKRYAALSTAVIIVMAVAGFAGPSRRERFEVIDVERINIIEKNGTLRLVISNRERAPDAIIAGKTYKRSGSNSAGMIFYNDEGNENGGLGWSGETRDGRYRASAGLLFDQYNQDQTVGVMYSDDNGRRSAGLRVWDRPDRHVVELADMVEPIKRMPDSPAKTRLMAAVRDSAARLGLAGAQRLFAGKLPDKSAAVVLSDAKGAARLRMAVDSVGNARIEFLDAQGRVTQRIPE